MRCELSNWSNRYPEVEQWIQSVDRFCAVERLSRRPDRSGFKTCRAKSKPDFIAKMGIVEEECDESLFGMEMLMDSALVTQNMFPRKNIKQFMLEVDFAGFGHYAPRFIQEIDIHETRP